MPITIDVTSDFICPWCLLANRRLSQAIGRRRGQRQVRRLERAGLTRGIRGVPHFDIAGTVVTGAQSPQLLREAIAATHLNATATDGQGA